jgi:hypothetical protein
VQCQLLFTHRFSLLTLMFWHIRPSSGVQIVVIKESGAHGNAVLFLLCSLLRLLLVMWGNHLFYLGVLELHVFALSVIRDVLC